MEMEILGLPSIYIGNAIEAGLVTSFSYQL